MITSVSTSDTYTDVLSDDAIWMELYPRLLCIIRRFVYMYRIPYWYGQEEEIARDVVQETARRLIERSQKAARGEANPIVSIDKMMVMIALNYIRDLRRHEYRMIRTPKEDYTSGISANVNEPTNMSEVATENAYSEWLFLVIALEIANFPCKQRRAILVDLANRMHFDEHPTPLQAAFLTAGIDLRDYQLSLSDNLEERIRHASLLSYAYKRLAYLAIVQQRWFCQN